jgi:hypothetical protein
MKRKFSWRSFISFGLFFYFFVILFSGIILYIAPPGRIANWTDWQLIGLTKSQWQTMHTNFSYLFAILSIFHLFTINWKTFWSYIKSKARAGMNRKREFYLAFVLSVGVFIGVVYLLPPFSSVMALGENIKEGWEEERKVPPIPHAEEYTVAQLSTDLLKIPEKDILSRLEELGIVVVSSEQTLKELAVQVALSPQEIYSQLHPASHNSQGRIQPGGGLGRKSLQQIAEENKLPLDELLMLLKIEGIDANGEELLRDLASENNLRPADILAILNNADGS